MQLSCPYCGHNIPAADINVERMVAKCASCSAVFGFEDQIDSASVQARKLAVPLPKGILVEQQGYATRWRSRGAG
jgi:DNA-directed RNA polymerase subunit RPC12/RpoP